MIIIVFVEIEQVIVIWLLMITEGMLLSFITLIVFLIGLSLNVKDF